jgi:hypothetical protein
VDADPVTLVDVQELVAAAREVIAQFERDLA